MDVGEPRRLIDVTPEDEPVPSELPELDPVEAPVAPVEVPA